MKAHFFAPLSGKTAGAGPHTGSLATGGLELWGGHECTLNRVHDRFRDQTLLTGHDARLEDIELFAGLGLKRLRYPALWERTECAPGVFNFAWLDERLAKILSAGMAPILGLLHHGSGPRWTSLVDDRFAQAFAGYAHAVAERYPWADAYTPINEPLTTARFSCLYGHWHPHARDERVMWTALLNQIDATRLAMRAIRRVNPAARLVQTEDLGFCQSAPRLAYQAAFENNRRWLTWDLLAGQVSSGHPLHAHLSGFGLAERLAAIADDPCPPDVIGVNHYPTSERFLDDAVENYSADLVGGNGRHSYADVEAVRVSELGMCGIGSLLAETWRRYQRPIAITERHNGCTREEQLRWLVEAWQEAEHARAQGCEVIALTAWSLLGGYDWDSLLTREDDHYESGVFDVRGSAPRPTALAETLRRLSRGDEPPLLSTGSGWWRRDVRLTTGRSVRPIQRPPASVGSAQPAAASGTRPVLITGASGTLGQAVGRACTLRGLAFELTDRQTLRIDDPCSVAAAIERSRPWAVINAAGWVRVDDAEDFEAACLAANATGPRTLAEACARADIPFVTFSSDLVFSGARSSPYTERDEPCPLNAYGRSKLEAERDVTAVGGRSLIIRTAAFFQENDPHNFASQVLARTAVGAPFECADDLVISPTYVPDLVRATLDLLIDGEVGLWHLANQGQLSWADFALRLAAAAGHDRGLIKPRPAKDFGWRAPRPAQVALDSGRGRLLPPLDDAIQRFVNGLRDLARRANAAGPLTNRAVLNFRTDCEDRLTADRVPVGVT